MGVVELVDRETIATVCRIAPAAHAYELGDLDDFFWPHTRWFGWDSGGEIEQLALLYEEHVLPVLIAIPNEPRIGLTRLLEEIAPRLPARLYAHTGADTLRALERRYAHAGAEPHVKMALAERERLVADGAPAVLRAADLREVKAFYEVAYPGTWFVPRMLETGRYVGLRDEAGLACVAGVHVWSPRWRVAALGNVATRPDVRGRGLARQACSALCRLLLADGIQTIALNVRAENAAAIRAYEAIGFAVVIEYVEVMLETAP